MPAQAPHQDKPFNHAPHIVGMIFTFGMWSGIWLWRWTFHKLDRNREAIFALAQQVDELSPRRGDR